MATLGVSHLAIGVTDMDRSLGFYRDLLGLEVTLDTEEALAGRDGRRYRRRAVYLRAPGHTVGSHEFFVVLDQQLDKEPFGSPPRLFQLGTHHVAFWVDDVERKVEQVRAAGLAVLVAPTASTPAAYGEPDGAPIVITAIVADPDGNPIQFDQRVTHPL